MQGSLVYRRHLRCALVVFCILSARRLFPRQTPTPKVSQSKGEIEAVQREIDTTRAQKDEVLRKKDDEIRALTLKMETMAFEFAGTAEAERIVAKCETLGFHAEALDPFLSSLTS